MSQTIKKSIRIPANDEGFLQWWDAQNSPSVSMRLLVAAWLQDNELGDVLISLSKGSDLYE